MSIIINAVKDVSAEGKRGYTITGITALDYSSLPQTYLNSNNRPSVFFQDQALYVNDPHKHEHLRCYPLLSIGAFYDEKDFANVLRVVRIAADHLHTVNQSLQDLRQTWHGEHTFVI